MYYLVDVYKRAAVAALKGIGIAILAEFACQNEIVSKQLIPIELDLEPAPLMLLAAYSNRQYMPARTRCFLDYLADKLEIE